MLLAINDRIKGWLGIVVVVLIGLPFALWGIQSYFDDTGPAYAAKVNDIEISSRELDFFTTAQRRKLAKEYGGKLPITDAQIESQVLEQLINQRTLESVTMNEGYRISDSLLALSLRQQFTIDGVFDSLRMESFLRQIGRSPQQYEIELRNELRVKQMQASLINSSLMTNYELEQLVGLDQQLRDVDILTFSTDNYTKDYQASTADIEAYYKKNISLFMLPETVKVDYVEITMAQLSDNSTIDEGRIDAMYQEYLDTVSQREERKASHILIKLNAVDAKKTLTELQEKLKAGESFKTLAETFSHDPGSAVLGGDLGWISIGDMVKSFEDALYGMEKSSISDVVETQFGYHLIKLDDVRSETVEPLGVKRYAFEDELRKEAARDQFFDLSEQLANKSYEAPDSLDDVVESLGIKLQTSEFFSKSGVGGFDSDVGRGIGGHEKVRNSAFSADVLEQGLNSDVIEISPEHILVLRLNDHQLPAAKPLEDVTESIKVALKRDSGYQKTLDAALAVKSQIESGAAVDSFVAEGVTLSSPGAVGRMDYTKIDESRILVDIFDMAVPTNNGVVVQNVDLSSGDVGLIVLKSVQVSELVSLDKKKSIKQSRLQSIATDEFAAVLSSVKSSANIDVNSRNLK